MSIAVSICAGAGWAAAFLQPRRFGNEITVRRYYLVDPAPSAPMTHQQPHLPIVARGPV